MSATPRRAPTRPRVRPDDRARVVLLASVAVTAVLYLVPYLRVLAWPLRLVSTVAHELGHGLAAVLLGGRFEALMMWSDGSGMASWSAQLGRLGHATVAAGGLVGPAVAAAALFLAGRDRRWARAALLVTGAGLLVVDLLVVRTLFGFLFVGAVGLTLVAVAVAGVDWLAQATVVFLAVQLALSVFSRGDYLFTPEAHTAQGVMPSDVAQIAEALVLPYWFWGACCGLLSVAVLLLGLVAYLRPGWPPSGGQGLPR